MVRAAVVMLGVLLLLASVATASSPTLDRPSWTPGDSWTYASNTTLIPGLNLTGTGTSTVRGRVPVAVGNTSVEAYDVLVSAEGTAGGAVATPNGTYTLAGSWVLTGEQKFDPVGVQLLYDLYELDVNGTANLVFPFTARVQNTTTYEVVSSGWQYPFAAGATGLMTVRYNFTRDFYSSLYPHVHQEGVGQWNANFSIDAPITVSTPAGSFVAFPITERWSDGSVDRVFAAPQVGNDARTESYDAGGNLTAISTLSAYRYQALEAPTFLGLTPVGWAGIIAIVAAAVAVLLVVRRRRRKKTSPRVADEEATSGPRGP